MSNILLDKTLLHKKNLIQVFPDLFFSVKRALL